MELLVGFFLLLAFIFEIWKVFSFRGDSEACARFGQEAMFSTQVCCKHQGNNYTGGDRSLQMSAGGRE